jgi:hypothetical protein
MKSKCRSNQCLRVGEFENGICPKCQKLIKQGFKSRKPIKKNSDLSFPKAFKEAKQTFQLLRRVQEADINGMVKCVHGSIKHYTKVDAGHYLPANYKYHCFNPLNVHPQEKNKNMDMHCVITVLEYREFLIKKIGLVEVEKMEQTHRLERKYSVFELIEMTKAWKLEIEQIKKAKNL